MREKYSGRKIMAICSNCEFWEWIEELNLDVCANGAAAITDFVNGLSLCQDINEEGTCPLWSKRPECTCEECQAKRNNAMSEDEVEELCKTNGIN